MFYTAAGEVIGELVRDNRRLLDIMVDGLAVNGPSCAAEAAAECKDTAANTSQVAWVVPEVVIPLRSNEWGWGIV